MAIRLGSTVINCADLEGMTRFWAGALDLKPSSTDPDDDFRVLRGPAGTISLQLAGAPVSARDQMHLDLYTDDQAGEVARLTGLGAVYVRHEQNPEDDYVVMTDPEGNEFCVVAVTTFRTFSEQTSPSGQTR
jgi:catechol 2,3-dioxygenase-like lactoylglutathione lyase family enzyme